MRHDALFGCEKLEVKQMRIRRKVKSALFYLVFVDSTRRTGLFFLFLYMTEDYLPQSHIASLIVLTVKHFIN